MRGCEVLWTVDEAAQVRSLLSAVNGGVCPCEEGRGCPVMGDWRQGERLGARLPEPEKSRGSVTVAVYQGTLLKDVGALPRCG